MANYYIFVSTRDNGNNLGTIIKHQRIVSSLTLQELSSKSGVSSSHLGRIERGERFPSARTLRKIARPLGFDEDELFTLAGYLSSEPARIAERAPLYRGEQLDPYVASMLARESVDVQRAVVGILSMLKSIAKSTK